MPFLCRLTSLAPAFLLLAAPALAADWRSIPYENFHSALTSLKPLKDARYIRVRQVISVSAPDMTLEDLRMVIASSGGDIEVPITLDGSMAFPLTDELLEENPPVRVNAPEGGLSLNVSIEIGMPPTDRFQYDAVVEMAAEYDRFVDQQGMMARMMAPDATGLHIEFGAGEPASASLSAPAGETIAANDEGILVIPLEEDWAGAEVVLSRFPDLIRLTFEE